MRLFKGKKMVLLFALLSIAAAMIGVVATLLGLQLRQTPVFEDTAAVRSQLQAREKELIDFTEYRRFVLESKETLFSHAKLLNVPIERSENEIHDLDGKTLASLKSNSKLLVSYQVGYVFGYDLSPEKFDIRESPQGLEIRIEKPKLMAKPEISKLKYRVLTGALTPNNQTANEKLQSLAQERAVKKGEDLAQSPEVVALCEKLLTENLSNFLQKQTGVVFVPRIKIVYPI